MTRYNVTAAAFDIDKSEEASSLGSEEVWATVGQKVEWVVQ